MKQLFYNGWRLRADAADLASKIGVDRLPQYYNFGRYAGMTRGETEHWHRFAKLVEATEALLVGLGMERHEATFKVHPRQSGTGCLKWFLSQIGIEYEGQEELKALFEGWDSWQQTYEEIRGRQPMLRLEELVSTYSNSAFMSTWFWGEVGQCKLLEWVERGCGQNLPFEDNNKVVTPALRTQLVGVRDVRVGWLLHTGGEEEYDLVWCDEKEVAAFLKKYGSG